MVIVTDLGYYMDGYEIQNLNEVPRFLKKAWDCVIIVSGHAKVRIGKSTKAMQQAYYLSWFLSGCPTAEQTKTNPIPFSIENVAFDPDMLIKKAEKLPSKVHPDRNLKSLAQEHSVIVYDEGRAGLDSARAMENINKAMQDFFQTCGRYGHIIIIVLPNYFRLAEDVAVPRSLFLTDVYTDEKYNRGYFAFYNEHQKELLYYLGRKRYGTTNRYMAVRPYFRGKFTKFFPIDIKTYEDAKNKSIIAAKITKQHRKWIKQRNAAMYLAKTKGNMTEQAIADEITSLSEQKINDSAVGTAIRGVERQLALENL